MPFIKLAPMISTKTGVWIALKFVNKNSVCQKKLTLNVVIETEYAS